MKLSEKFKSWLSRIRVKRATKKQEVVEDTTNEEEVPKTTLKSVSLGSSTPQEDKVELQTQLKCSFSEFELLEENFINKDATVTYTNNFNYRPSVELPQSFQCGGVDNKGKFLKVGEDGYIRLFDETIPSIQTMYDMFFPVGSRKIQFQLEASPNDTLPAGVTATWVLDENYNDKFIKIDSTSELGTTGGEKVVKLTVDQLPSHTHDRGTMNITGTLAPVVTDRGWDETTHNGCFSGTTLWGGDGPQGTGGGRITINFNAANNWTGRTGSAGIGANHNNEPQYKTIKVWARIA